MKRSLVFGVCFVFVLATLVFAQDSRARSSVLAIVACATSAACTGGSNTGTGPGVLGQSKSSHGVIGNTLFNSTGASNGESAVFGQDLSTAGTYDMGVQGTSVRGYGVRGRSSSNAGVRGDSGTSGYGVVGSGGIAGVNAQGSSYGIIGQAQSVGVLGVGANDGVIAESTAGTALNAITTGTSVWAITAQSNNGSGVQVSAASRGADMTGGYAGLVGRSTSYPIIAALPSGAIVFYIDANGNVYMHGSLHTFATPGGATATASYTRAATPAIEDTGTAHLAFGTANVYLSPAFARSIDPRLGYQVFLTPGGDTRGLYVANKYAGGFTVREVQGGRGTFSFDYHVYAHSAETGNASVAPANAPVLAPVQSNERPISPPAVTRP